MPFSAREQAGQDGASDASGVIMIGVDPSRDLCQNSRGEAADLMEEGAGMAPHPATRHPGT
jgi:hypothetical protein